MKKTFFMLLLAVIIGFTVGIFFLRKLNINNTENTMSANDFNNNKIGTYAYAFQIGVFENKDNANNSAEQNHGIIINDDGKYRVYIAILQDKNLIAILKNYYTTLGINFYLKEISISDKTHNIIDNYEALLNNCDATSYNKIINSMLSEIDINNL